MESAPAILNHADLWSQTVPLRTRHLRVGNYPAGECENRRKCDDANHATPPPLIIVPLLLPGPDGSLLLHPQRGPGRGPRGGGALQPPGRVLCGCGQGFPPGESRVHFFLNHLLITFLAVCHQLLDRCPHLPGHAGLLRLAVPCQQPSIRQLSAKQHSHRSRRSDEEETISRTGGGGRDHLSVADGTA